MKRKNIIILGLIALSVIYYVLFFTMKLIITDNLLLKPALYKINENCIIVQGQAVTGPVIKVVKGEEYLLESVVQKGYQKDINVTEIEMTGKSIFNDILEYPDYYVCDWLIYGRVIETTDMYDVTGSGTIPIFETERIYPIVTLPVFFTLEMNMLPIHAETYSTAILLFIWPIVVLIITIQTNNKK